MTYQPPQPPPHPHWAPQPPAKKPTPWKLIGGITAAVVVLCCGGFVAIGIFTGPPAEQTKPGSTVAPLAAPVQSTTTVAPDAPAVSSKPAAAPTSPAAKRSDPAAKRSSPAAMKTSKTAGPTPKKTTRKPKPTTREPDPEPEEVSYENCTAVREAGAAPIRRGDPGYAPHLDRDGDGVGCAGD